MNDWTNPMDSTLPLVEKIRLVVDELTLNHEDHQWQDQLTDTGKPNGRALVKLPREALITQIRAAIYGDLGKTHGGHLLARERNLMDLGAFTLYEDITGRIEGHYRYLIGARPVDPPETALRQWFIAFNNNFRRGDYPDLIMHRTLTELRSWSRRISTYFDPPRVKDLLGPCPIETCGATEVGAEDEAKQPALYVTYRSDEEPIVRCRNCGTYWEGRFALYNLGRHLGATSDEDALREMGLDVDAFRSAA